MQVITYKGGDCCHLQLCEKVTHIFRHGGLVIPQSSLSIVDKQAPLITKKVRGFTCPWINGSIKREIRQREFLLNKARRSNLDEDWSAYRRSRNRVTKLVRDSKSRYSIEQMAKEKSQSAWGLALNGPQYNNILKLQRKN